MASESSGRDPVEKLAEEFAERYRQGERPSVTEYTERYPDLAGEIRELFPALVEMEQLASVEGAGTGPCRLVRQVKQLSGSHSPGTASPAGRAGRGRAATKESTN